MERLNKKRKRREAKLRALGAPGNKPVTGGKLLRSRDGRIYHIQKWVPEYNYRSGTMRLVYFDDSNNLFVKVDGVLQPLVLN
jgi:mRNA-degrading endonuclease RelE of RelBE toxin-antitoxin system